MQQDCFVFHAHAKSRLSCGLHGWPETVPSSLAGQDRTKAAKGSCTREEQKDVSDVSVKAVKGRESYI